ncbi:MAG: CBS and ACT domain-containing protein [Anaerolineales bacterium]
MFVGERMSHPVITVHPDLSIQDALALMRNENIRRLPIVNQRGGLIGIVSDRDLLHASPSDATSLSVWELNYLLSKITVEQIMTRKVHSVTPNTPVEDAARLMADNKIGGLPVLDDAELVGIITETDLFKLFLELLGARDAGVRFTVLVPDVPGELAKLTSIIRDLGGNIVAMVQAMGESSESREVTLKVVGVEEQKLSNAIQPEVLKIIDIRTTKPA